MCLILLCGCSEQITDNDVTNEVTSISLPDTPVAASSGTPGKGTRDNTPHVLNPAAGGKTVYNCSVASIDATNITEGYVVVSYSGSSPKVKLQITGSDNVTYTYNLSRGSDVFPLSAGSGSYTIAVYENVSGNQYATAMSQSVNAAISNTFGPFLYPNQYVKFDAGSNAVALAESLAQSANTDLDVVSNVYNYIITNIAYDHDQASSVKSGYVPNVDQVLTRKQGICLDYAALMTAMLRSQQIPTRLEVGYAGNAYHAWISTYIQDVGWVNGIIQFDGNNWELMDPTFAANSSEKALKKFIGDGNNYIVKYIY
ncbi:MAG: transglutaminase-like domain-containing protein [Lachnospiraceae bacterium]|nr:transglutaminase-like domain-containing protein [Lachnospiraceae bacterium]